MSPLNTLSAGYKSHPTAVKSSNNRPIVIDNSPKIDSKELSKKLIQYHSDGVLSTSEVNYIISQLQTIV